MEKSANTQYPIHELLERRWSPRAFSSQAVEPDKLRSLLEAARWAASSFNAQPWNFLIARREDKDPFEKLLNCLVPGNIAWAKQAPVLMLSVAKLNFDHNSRPNPHAWHDVGQAVANLTVQATVLGLEVHQMAGFDPQRAREQFHIPEGYDPVAMIALGYSGDLESLPEPLREKELQPRSRKPLESFVFAGEWGKTASLVSQS